MTTPEAATRRARLDRRDLLGVGFLVLVFVVAVWGRLDWSLGRSHDGFNTAVWMDGGRAIVDDGLAASKLGAHVDGEDYAHHPPGLYLVGAAAHLVGGTRPFVARLPGVFSVVAGLAIGWVLLRELGRSRLACFAALSFVVAAPMVLLYGPMLNHESLALPWALAAVLVVVRAHRGPPPPVWLAALVGFGGAILSWQGTLLVGLLTLALVVPAWRPPVHGRRVVAAMAVAAGAAVVCTVVWQVWVYGDFGNVVDAVRFRVDGEEPTEFGFVSAQVHFLYRGFPIWTLALTAYGLLLVWRDRVEALAVAALVASVALYTLAFRQGATVHSYWNYWAVMVALLATAAVVDRHAPRVLRSPQARRVAVAACALVAVVFSVVLDVRGVGEVALGARAGDVVRGTPVPASQASYYTLVDFGEAQPWVRYAVRRPSVVVTSASEVEAIAEREPDAVVLVRRESVDALRPGTFDALTGRFLADRDPYATVTAGVLAAALR